MSHDLTAPQESARFPTTVWEEIGVVQDRTHLDHVATLNRFVASYWKPIFYYCRARGIAVQAAEDLTQEFFLCFLEKDWIRRADPERGRFRNFLLRIVQRFLADRGPSRAARQQRFEKQFVTLCSLIGPDERSFEPPTDLTPEAVFMKEWATSLVRSVQATLRDLCAAEGRQLWYDLFAAIHLSTVAEPCLSQERLAARHGLTRDQVRYALEQAEQRFRALLRARVRTEVSAEREIDDEIGELLVLLGQ